MNGIRVREGEASDTAFVIATWLHQYKHFSFHAKRIKHSVFYRQHHALVERVLAKPDTRIFIAHPDHAPEVILGFLVVERPQAIHFAFVKEEIRRKGIARLLFRESETPTQGAIFTHWTCMMNEIYPNLGEMTYNPYAV